MFGIYFLTCLNQVFGLKYLFQMKLQFTVFYNDKSWLKL